MWKRANHSSGETVQTGLSMLLSFPDDFSRSSELVDVGEVSMVSWEKSESAGLGRWYLEKRSEWVVGGVEVHVVVTFVVMGETEVTIGLSKRLAPRGETSLLGRWAKLMAAVVVRLACDWRGRDGAAAVRDRRFRLVQWYCRGEHQTKERGRRRSSGFCE